MYGRLKLRDSVTKEVQVTRTVKEALYADKCAHCGEVLQMHSWCNDENLGRLQGTFEGSNMVCDSHGKGMGNQFSCFVCCFSCAHGIVVGGWKRIEHYKPFVEAGRELVRAELRITTLITCEEDLINEWERDDSTKT